MSSNPSRKSGNHQRSSSSAHNSMGGAFIERINSTFKKNRIWFFISCLIVVIFILTILFIWIFFGTRTSLDDLFSKDCAAAHNQLRVKHAAKLMTIDPKLIEMAAQRAQKLVHLDQLVHLPQDKGVYYGENLHMIYGDYANCKVVTQSWYDEFKEAKYDFAHPNYHPLTGHATQVVWSASTKIGCAQRSFQQYGRPKQYTVCLYDPAGNIIGLFDKNVFKPKF